MRAPVFLRPFTMLGDFVTRRIRHQIIFPYLLLATALALTGTYLLLSAANQSLHDRFNQQLLDAAQGGADRLARAEMEQVAGLRAIAFTLGFPEAVAGNDRLGLELLAAPQAANYGFDSVIVVSRDGRLLLSLPRRARVPIGDGLGQQATRIAPGVERLAQAALNPSGEIDKVSGVAEDTGGPVFYTAGPVRRDEQIVGVVLVGSDLSKLLRQVGRDSLSDGVSLYGAGGMAFGHTSALSGQVINVPELPQGWQEEILARPQDRVRVRTITVGSETYVEAIGPVPGRGLGEQPPGVYGVMLNTRALDARLQQTLALMVPVFMVGLVLVVLIGNTLAGRIDRPVWQLVTASGRVARGDLEVRVPETRKDELGVLAARFNDMVGGLKQLLFVKDLFGRFVSPEVSAKLMGGEIELGGEQREVTVLFADLRDFVQISEAHSPTEVVELLNEYFRKVVNAARAQGGIVNKFGGDSTLIIFGAPMDMPDHADRALAAALAMREALGSLNDQRAAEGKETLRQGIGINTGTVVAGQIGSQDRMEYTVIGDAVNLAARLQELTKQVEGCDIVLSGSTWDALADPTVWSLGDLGRVKVRGKQSAVQVYSLSAVSEPEPAEGVLLEETGPADDRVDERVLDPQLEAGRVG